jgi:adenosine deaminase
MERSLADFARGLPKAELHLHIEGTLEPEMMFELATRNGIDLPFRDVASIRAAYSFTDLQSFLDIYYQGAGVLVTEQDFHDLMYAYLERANTDGVVRAEVFFDPQTHTARGIGFDVFMPGFLTAIDRAEATLGMSVGLIMCFLRHLPADDASETWEAAHDYHDVLLGVGLDSSEVGFPPDTFEDAYRRARAAGLHAVAHAGEEGPPSYIDGALDRLGAERIDHGVRAEEDDEVLHRLVKNAIPLTMCPMSNLALQVVDRLEDHNLKRLMDRGVKVTINSDDPAYFGGYIGDNYVATAEALDLTKADLAIIARNSLEASFAADTLKSQWVEQLDRYVAGQA